MWSGGVVGYNGLTSKFLLLHEIPRPGSGACASRWLGEKLYKATRSDFLLEGCSHEPLLQLSGLVQVEFLVEHISFPLVRHFPRRARSWPSLQLSGYLAEITDRDPLPHHGLLHLLLGNLGAVAPVFRSAAARVLQSLSRGFYAIKNVIANFERSFGSRIFLMSCFRYTPRHHQC